MKFYYKGQLIRTSKNHHYTHAIIIVEDNEFKCVACSSSRELAEKAFENLAVYKNYRIMLSVKNGTYKKKDRWSKSIEELRSEAINEYGSVDEELNYWENAIGKYEIVEIEEA